MGSQGEEGSQHLETCGSKKGSAGWYESHSHVAVAFENEIRRWGMLQYDSKSAFSVSANTTWEVNYLNKLPLKRSKELWELPVGAV